MSELGDCSEALKLFRECSLEQVRDYNLELSSKIDETRNKFREELKTHYKDILKVTEEVDRLHQELKTGDALFMDLCFKDDLYRLTKLPEFQENSNPGIAKAKSSAQLNEASSQAVLAVSQWVLAVSDLISRFMTSYSSSKLFDAVMQGFDDLKLVRDKLSGYQGVIRSKCRAFLEFACSPDISFSVQQRIQVYDLVVVEGNDFFQWDSELSRKLEQQTFSFIFQSHLDDTLNSKDELISSFVAAEKFKQKLSSKLKADIDLQMQRLDVLSEPKEADMIASDLSTLSTTGIQELIQNSQYYCMGLVTERMVEWYKTVTSLTALIQRLEQYGGRPLSQELRTKLLKKLQNDVSQPASMPSDNQILTGQVVAKVLEDFNRENFNKTVQSTIESLTA